MHKHSSAATRTCAYVSLNKQAVKKQALVTFVDGRKIKAANLPMTSDSTYWTSPNGTFTNKITTAQVKEVRFRSAGRRRQ